MKRTILFSIFIFLFLVSACTISKDVANAETYKNVELEQKDANTKTNKNLVLVELFTSEGCSSCPPADRALAKLQKDQPVENVEIITLAFHVDYWNYLGWKDEFSSAKFSKRQTKYSLALNLQSNYTPQMIVDGKTQFVGSNVKKALEEIKKAGKNKKGNIKLSLQENNKLKVKISELPKNDGAEILLVITEDDLETDVKRGENKGQKLSHISVVRDLTNLGEIPENKNDFEVEGDLNLKTDWKKENLKLIVFAQSLITKEVLAIGSAEIN